jgi:hypothetical protein
MPLRDLASKELLRLHAQICDQLRERDILRSANNTTADVAEILFCRAFGWTRAKKAPSAADAMAQDGNLYRIRGCRINRPNASRQLTISDNLPKCRFDFLAVVLFESDYSIRQAALVPYAKVLEYSVFSAPLNNWIFQLYDHVWERPEVRDVTFELRQVVL